MVKFIRYRMKYGSYLRNEQGIKKFAEMALGQLLRRVTKRSAFYREMNENLLVEKANLRMRATELAEQPMLEAGAFFSVRRRLWANTSLIAVTLVAGVFLAFVSVTAFLGAADASDGALTWAVALIFALVLTGGGILVTERLIETLIPRNGGAAEQGMGDPKAIAILWGVLLAGIMLSLLGLSEVRATQLASANNSSMLYLGFIALSMLMPIIAGAVRWDAMRLVDTYKTTQAHRAIDSRLAQIDSILRQNEEFESNFYKIRLLSDWDEVNEFKTYKDNYNDRKGITENLAGHFAQSYDLFQAEASKRYEMDIRDITAKSLRKLESVETSGKGSKLSQLASIPAPIDETESPIYLAPKPVH